MTKTSATALPVEIRALSKFYGAVRACENVSLDINAGEFLTLLGPSGSGKTTLLMMIAGFSRPDSGSVRVGGQEIVHLPPHKRDIGMVFQNYALFPHMSVAENVAYPLRLRRIGKSEIEDRVKRVLDLVQLGSLSGRKITELSGGQRQRIALARAIVFEPRILLMDEPLSALDKQLRETMQIEIRRLHDRLGMTTISVTHDQREALTMSDRIAVFSKGQLAQVSTPEGLYDRPDNRFVAEFIGESAFLPLKRVGGQALYGQQPLRLGEASGRLHDDMVLMKRPERLRFLAPGEAASSGTDNYFQGRVVASVYQGECKLFEVELEGGHHVFVRVANRAENMVDMPATGAPVTLRLQQSDTRLVSAEV